MFYYIIISSYRNIQQFFGFVLAKVICTSQRILCCSAVRKFQCGHSLRVYIPYTRPDACSSSGHEYLFANASPRVIALAEKAIIQQMFGPEGIPEDLITVHVRWSDKKVEKHHTSSHLQPTVTISRPQLYQCTKILLTTA